jgi:predicted MPP superfamily phosphohydrolase
MPLFWPIISRFPSKKKKLFEKGMQKFARMGTMKKWKLTIRILSFLGVVFTSFGLYFYTHNDNSLHLSYYTMTTKKYSGTAAFKVVQLSDLHNHSLAYDNGSIPTLISDLHPDALVLTGDFIDDHTRDYSWLESLGKSFKAFSIPVLYVDGNHERKAPSEITEKEHVIFETYGFKNLNKSRFDCKNGIVFSGLQDPGKNHRYGYDGTSGVGDVPEQLEALKTGFDSNNLNVMLCHRPDLFGLVSDQSYDLMFSGHTHGGQIVLGHWAVANAPWTKYIAGEYERNGAKLIVSRGLGESYNLPVRYHCPAELTVTTIKSEA